MSLLLLLHGFVIGFKYLKWSPASVSYVWICNVPNFFLVEVLHENLFFRFVYMTSDLLVKTKVYTIFCCDQFQVTHILQFWTQVSKLDNMVKLPYLETQQKKRRDIMARITPRLSYPFCISLVHFELGDQCWCACNAVEQDFYERVHCVRPYFIFQWHGKHKCSNSGAWNIYTIPTKMFALALVKRNYLKLLAYPKENMLPVLFFWIWSNWTLMYYHYFLVMHWADVVRFCCMWCNKWLII